MIFKTRNVRVYTITSIMRKYVNADALMVGCKTSADTLHSSLVQYSLLYNMFVYVTPKHLPMLTFQHRLKLFWTEHVICSIGLEHQHCEKLLTCPTYKNLGIGDESVL